VTTTSAAGRARGEGRGQGGAGRGGYRGLCLAVSLASGCQLFGQDPARCEQSVATVRQAISFKDFKSARTWREYTWKVCDERGVVATLDKEILDAEAAAAAEAETARKNSVKLAKDRINAAQKLWRAFDAEPAANRNEQTLGEVR